MFELNSEKSISSISNLFFLNSFPYKFSNGNGNKNDLTYSGLVEEFQKKVKELDPNVHKNWKTELDSFFVFPANIQNKITLLPKLKKNVPDAEIKLTDFKNGNAVLNSKSKLDDLVETKQRHIFKLFEELFNISNKLSTKFPLKPDKKFQEKYDRWIKYKLNEHDYKHITVALNIFENKHEKVCATLDDALYFTLLYPSHFPTVANEVRTKFNKVNSISEDKTTEKTLDTLVEDVDKLEIAGRNSVDALELAIKTMKEFDALCIELADILIFMGN